MHVSLVEHASFRQHHEDADLCKSDAPWNESATSRTRSFDKLLLAARARAGTDAAKRYEMNCQMQQKICSEKRRNACCDPPCLHRRHILEVGKGFSCRRYRSRPTFGGMEWPAVRLDGQPKTPSTIVGRPCVSGPLLTLFAGVRRRRPGGIGTSCPGRLARS